SRSRMHTITKRDLRSDVCSYDLDFEKSDEIKQMVDLQYDYSVQPALSLDYSQQVEEYFSLERVAMIQQGNWVYPTIEEMDPEFAEENIGIIPIPVEGAEEIGRASCREGGTGEVGGWKRER